MCGFISGINNNGWNTRQVEAGLSLISHRGPDGHNTFIYKSIMLAHTRLSIVGVNNGVQPIEAHGIYIVVNGEFYDYEIIRKNLEKKGFSFKTRSDSEILIYLYLTYGVDCLQYLEGEFAFTLYDSNKNLWFCARDRFGVRPIHYTQTPHGFMFASEVKALSPFIPLQLDKDSLWFSQHFQYLAQGKTFFKNVSIIKPAHYIIIKNGVLNEVCYWTQNQEETTDSLEVAQEKIEQLISNAVERRIPKEVKACTHLSGGIDSSTVTQLASTHNIKDAYTISFTDNNFYNEVELAELTATKLGIRLHVVPVNFQNILKSIPKAIYHAEGLSINGHLGGKYLLNKAIHEGGFKVALSGEGSDEIFMGYSHLKQDYLSKSSLSQMETGYLLGFQLPSGATFDLSQVEKHLGFVPTWLSAKSSIAHKLSSLWSSDFSNKLNPNQELIDNMPRLDKTHLKQSSFLWSRYCLSGYILKVLDDAQAMAHGVEGRLPFLDTQLAQYALSLPDEYYFKGNIEKHILRSIMKDKLPNEVVDKTKQSFMSPPITTSLSQKNNENLVYSLIDNKHFVDSNTYNQQALHAQIKKWKENPTNDSEPVFMTILSIAAFCQEFKL